MSHIYKLVVFLVVFQLCSSSRVLELSDRFLDLKKEGHWLIMFYAPWCAHCRRLEPVWALVAQSLYQTNVRVGKIDCIKYPSVSTHFNVNAFPTIMFSKGDEKDYVFNGERTKDEIAHFALRLTGPPVQQITRQESIDTLKSSQKIFFVYVGSFEGNLWEIYYEVAERFQPFSYFYATAPDIAKKHISVKEVPTVFVYKENNHYLFKPSNKEIMKDVQALNASLTEWVNAERFATFVKITRGNIHQFRSTNKNLVLAVVKENKLEEIPEDMEIFRDMIKSVIEKYRDQFHKWFQFGWIGSPELANSIAMTELPLPYLLVVNSSTNHHHIPDDEPHVLNIENVKLFLDTIRNESAPFYGGNSLPIRLYRTYFEARASLSEMWKGNPVLTAVLFGLPLGFLSLICYSICCADILDADEEDEEPLLSEFSHEKKE